MKGILSDQDETKENFLQTLLYSDQIQENEFEQRSLICLTAYLVQLSQDQYQGKQQTILINEIDIAQRLFESWQKRQNDLVSQKLTAFFNKTNGRLKLGINQAMDQWKMKVNLINYEEAINQLKVELSSVKKELKIEQEERLQYQQNYEADAYTTNQYSSRPFKSTTSKIQVTPKDIKDSAYLEQAPPEGISSQISVNNNTFDGHFISPKAMQRFSADSSSNIKKQLTFMVDSKQSTKLLMKELKDETEDKQQIERNEQSLNDDEIRKGLEEFLLRKFNDGLPEGDQKLTSAQQRELDHLMGIVRRIKNESDECTFHPQINPKTLKILIGNPAYQMQQPQLYDRLYLEGKQRQMTQSKLDEIRYSQEVAQCTFSPRTNSPHSPDDRLSPKETFQRLHYQEIENRQEKLSKKQAEKLDSFKKEYTFKPDRPKTKQMDSFLIKSLNKENENDTHHYDRLYKDYMNRAEKLENKRQVQKEHELALMNGVGRKGGASRSKSNRKSKIDVQSVLEGQINSMYPQTATHRNTQHFTSQKSILPHSSFKQSYHQNQPAGQALSPKSPLSKTLHHTSTTPNLDAFSRLYHHAHQSKKKKEKLRSIIDKELGISFSPQMFKSPKKYEVSPSSNVIERNQEFQKQKIQKLQEKEDSKYQDCTFEPVLVSRRNYKGSQKQSNNFESFSTNQSQNQVGDRLYKNALQIEEKKERKRLEMEQKMKQQYLKRKL